MPEQSYNTPVFSVSLVSQRCDELAAKVPPSGCASAAGLRALCSPAPLCFDVKLTELGASRKAAPVAALCVLLKLLVVKGREAETASALARQPRVHVSRYNRG